MDKKVRKEIIKTFFEHSRDTVLKAYFKEDYELPVMIPILLEITDENAQGYLVEKAMEASDKEEQLEIIKKAAKELNACAIFIATEASMRKYEKDKPFNKDDIEDDNYVEKKEVVVISCESDMGTILELHAKKDKILVLEESINTIEDPSINIGGAFSNLFKK